uniref:USP domain-containing protein n=1 Tax=Gasterosteus aculeatus aculeatus TaxID=481459 RepID=A0AAQ4PXP3_GASAC
MNHYLVERFKEKLDNCPISDYHGLINPGLTCYLNSILQVLFMTEDFREAVNRCRSEDSTTIDRQLRIIFAHLQKHLAKTNNLTKELGIINKYKQRDAAEYLEKILCLTSPEASKIFRGELTHSATCLKCNETNDSRGFFWLLPLTVEDLPHQTCSVVQNCSFNENNSYLFFRNAQKKMQAGSKNIQCLQENGLEGFFKGERVCRENKVYCNRCKEKQSARFRCKMTQSPEILTLLLKRFQFDYKLRCYVKLHLNVEVPQTLHTQHCKYDLYALVNHFGSLTGGHYTAHIKSFETHTWYHFNDDRVNSVMPPLFGTRNTFLRSPTAYLLMYRKGYRPTKKPDKGLKQPH